MPINEPLSLDEHIERARQDLSDAFDSLQGAHGADKGAAARQYDRAAAKLARLESQRAGGAGQNGVS